MKVYQSLCTKRLSSALLLLECKKKVLLKKSNGLNILLWARFCPFMEEKKCLFYENGKQFTIQAIFTNVNKALLFECHEI